MLNMSKSIFIYRKMKLVKNPSKIIIVSLIRVEASQGEKDQLMIVNQNQWHQLG